MTTVSTFRGAEPHVADQRHAHPAAADPARPLVVSTVPDLDADGRMLPRGGHAWWDRPVKAGIVLLVATLLVSGGLTGFAFKSRYGLFGQHPLQAMFWISTIGYGLIMYAAFAWRVMLWMRYKPMPAVDDARLPKTTVIIPAYNEGALVRQSIGSVARNRFPRDKLQVIVIDDGSSDDTWAHIQAAAVEFDDVCNITTHRQPQNKGKREALYYGFQHATGDVIVTMDSDSIFAPDALRHAVSPIVLDPRIGNVAGSVEVLNPYDSIWTRFLKCTFSLSFKFVRAYQSQFRGVFCTPGALSVFRADLVRKVADEWRDQHFMGKPCKTGEDRHMTNLAIREGYHVVYQQSARVYAEMPADYRGVTSMFLRWARSNIRETIYLQRFMFKPFRRDEHVNAFRINMLLVLSTLIVPYLLIANSIAVIAMHPWYLLNHNALVLFFALTMSAIVWRNDRGTDWIWLLLYQLIWTVGFVWIMPYAALTLGNTSWITRGGDDPASDDNRSASSGLNAGDSAPIGPGASGNAVPAVARASTRAA